MAFAQSESAKLYWESTGAGAPVLLVMGLGMNATGWWRTVPVLAESLRVIAFDNRGVGRSDVPDGPYSVTQMADDAMAILDAAGEESAHVYGISLGGMIAQEIALRHPHRVRKLVLGCTTAGGSNAAAIDDDVVQFFLRRRDMPAEEGVWASVPYNYGPRTRREHAQRIAEDIAQRLRYPVQPAGYAAQLEGALHHNAYDRLDVIRAETLVVHGDVDRMVPAANAKILADGIPGARLETWPEAGHLYFTDAPDADPGVLGFLTANEPSSPGP